MENAKAKIGETVKQLKWIIQERPFVAVIRKLFMKT